MKNTDKLLRKNQLERIKSLHLLRDHLQNKLDNISNVDVVNNSFGGSIVTLYMDINQIDRDLMDIREEMVKKIFS